MQFATKIYNNNRQISYTIVRSFLRSNKRGCILCALVHTCVCVTLYKGVDEVLTSTWVLLMNAWIVRAYRPTMSYRTMKKSFENYERKRDRLSEICFIEKESEIVKRIARKDKKRRENTLYCIWEGMKWNGNLFQAKGNTLTHSIFFFT